MTVIRTDEPYDVVVVGAGPAGSTAAYHLGGAREVLVVDRVAFPRHKACGGALVGCRSWPRELPNYAVYYAMKSGQLAGCILAEGLEGAPQRYRGAVAPLARAVSWLGEPRPGLITAGLSSYLHLADPGARLGLGGLTKGPFVQRFVGRSGATGRARGSG